MVKKSADALWSGSPSQWVNLKIYVIGFAIVALSVIWGDKIASALSRLPGIGAHHLLIQKLIILAAVLIALWRALELRFHHYEITNDVLREKFGILNRQIHELELYRVRDTTTYRPFDLNIFGCGNVIIDTTDHSTPVTVIRGIKKSDEVRKLLREKVEEARRRKGVVELGNV